jgi:Kdo2-lipid IVA lauroyltransferase/acyltransferase
MIGLLRGVFATARTLGPDRASDIGAALARAGGPLLPQHRIALANVRAAYPEKSDAEVGAIVMGAWDNLGRIGAEYAHLKTLFDFDPDRPGTGRIEVEGIEEFLALRDDGKPGLIFSAHLANWELPAICAARFGLDATAVFRPTNDIAVAQVVHEIRSSTMGGLAASRQGAAFEMSAILERGGHLGMLVDQHFTRGVLVDFLGAKFARRFECPVHGVRVIRLPENRFRLELTGPLTLPRNAKGDIDIQASMQAMTDVVAGWVREHPEQWLWMHRRWRVPMAPQANVTSA